MQRELTAAELKLFRQLSTYSEPFLPSEAHLKHGHGENYWTWFFTLIRLMRIGLFQITAETKQVNVLTTFEITETGKAYLDEIDNWDILFI